MTIRLKIETTHPTEKTALIKGLHDGQIYGEIGGAGKPTSLEVTISGGVGFTIEEAAAPQPGDADPAANALTPKI